MNRDEINLSVRSAFHEDIFNLLLDYVDLRLELSTVALTAEFESWRSLKR